MKRLDILKKISLYHPMMMVWLIYTFSALDSLGATYEPQLIEGSNGVEVSVFIFGKSETHLLGMNEKGEALSMSFDNLSARTREWVSINVPLSEERGNFSEFRFQVANHIVRQDNPDRDISTQLFLKSALDGHVESQARLSICYLKGWSVDKNEIIAYRWAKKAADAGSVEGNLLLGYYLYAGRGSTRNPRLSEKSLTEAANAGSARAHHVLGDFYGSPIVFRDFDFNKAVFHYKEGMYNSWFDSAYALSELYRNNRIVSFTGTITSIGKETVSLNNVRMGGRSASGLNSGVPTPRLISDYATLNFKQLYGKVKGIGQKVEVFFTSKATGRWEAFNLDGYVAIVSVPNPPRIDWATWEREMEIWKLKQEVQDLADNLNRINNWGRMRGFYW